MGRLKECVCGLVLLLVLAGHVATLAYAYHHHHHRQLMLGVVVLCSVLVLPLLALLLPDRRVFLRRAWLALHVTYSDDLARRALNVLFDLQVMPLLHAMGLAPPDTLDYWWWVLQGLLLATLATHLPGPTAPDDDSHDDDPDPDPDPVAEDEYFEEVDLSEVVVVAAVKEAGKLYLKH